MRLLLSLIFFLLMALFGPLLTSTAFAQRETLDVTINRAHMTEAKSQASYTSTVKNGVAPYHYHWFVYAPNGSTIKEEEGDARYVPDFDYTIPAGVGRYTIKLFVTDSKKNYGNGAYYITINKPGVGGGPTVSDLTPIINGPDFVEVGEEYRITWDAQGSGVGKVEWEWLTPRGPMTTKGLKGKIAQAGNAVTVTLLAWDQVIPKDKAIRQSHTVHAVAPLTTTISSTGARRLGPREFQMDKGKPFTLVATPGGGVGHDYKVQWGGRAEGRNYGGTINRVGVGHINLAIHDEGRYKTTAKTWDITIRVADSDNTPAPSGDLSGWWLYLWGGKVDQRVPLIVNPRSSDGHYTGAYFPDMRVKNLVRSPSTVVSNLQIYPQGAHTFAYTYQYNDGSDKGKGTMTVQGNQVRGPWNSTVGNGSGTWTWVRPTPAELTKLRAHFGRG